MNSTTIRVGALILPLFALLPACTANVRGSETAGTTASAVSATSDGTAVSYEGRGTALQVRAGVALPGLALGASIEISDTGLLPSTGGDRSATLVEAEAAGLVGTGVLNAKTSSNLDGASSSSSVDELAIRLPGLLVTANVLAARATATCGSCGADMDGGADIAGLAIDGKGIVITGTPNQTINLGVAKIVINEVTMATSSTGKSEIHVAALHVTALGIADIVISAASAGVSCTYRELPTDHPLVSSASCSSSASCIAGDACYNDACVSGT